MADRTVLHVDMNCFYASVEMLHRPQMRNVPMAVGGDPQARHGIVLTANYLAKRQGVKTGMALWQARQVCPAIQFVPPRMDLYLRFPRMAQHKIDRPTNITSEIAQEAYRIFRATYQWEKPIRSLGVRGAELTLDHAYEQLDIFCDYTHWEKQEKADAAVDEIRKRFGYFSIQRGLMYQDKLLSSLDAKGSHTVHPQGYFS